MQVTSRTLGLSMRFKLSSLGSPLNRTPHTHKVVIAGNHDVLLDHFSTPSLSAIPYNLVPLHQTSTLETSSTSVMRPLLYGFPDSALAVANFPSTARRQRRGTARPPFRSHAPRM